MSKYLVEEITLWFRLCWTLHCNLGKIIFKHSCITAASRSDIFMHVTESKGAHTQTIPTHFSHSRPCMERLACLIVFSKNTLLDKRKAEASQRFPRININAAESTTVSVNLIKKKRSVSGECVLVTEPGGLIFQDEEEEPVPFIRFPGAVSKAHPCSAWE